jgi:hypothetical protein
LDYAVESRAAPNRSVFSTAIAALVLQYPSGTLQFKRIGAEKGDSGYHRGQGRKVCPGIYGTRPWVIYGEGPSVKNDATVVDDAVNPPRGLGQT